MVVYSTWGALASISVCTAGSLPFLFPFPSPYPFWRLVPWPLSWTLGDFNSTDQPTTSRVLQGSRDLDLDLWLVTAACLSAENRAKPNRFNYTRVQRVSSSAKSTTTTTIPPVHPSNDKR
ncbi:hypothetical protein FRB91_008301 [Serendipita sp. 411]|nr:hypothetical protein FRB91_008301 [Serendipita sp. 411]